ncbi:MAG: tRNA (adenine-N1)-methyltransferase [Promethearchaeota archaeon]
MSLIGMFILSGDTLLLQDTRKDRSWLLVAQPGQKFFTHHGTIEFDSLINKVKYGSFIKTNLNYSFLVLKPTVADFIRHFKKRTQVIYEDDCGIIVGLSGIGPGSRVIEAGTGAGGLTCFLAFHVRPNGIVYSYDCNEEHQLVAKKNLALTPYSSFVSFRPYDITHPDCPLEENVEAVILDFSTPWRAVKNAHKALKPGGSLIIFVPSWGQVERSVAACENSHLLIRSVFELIRRDFRVSTSAHIVRPLPRMVGFSAVIIHAIKIIP